MQNDTVYKKKGQVESKPEKRVKRGNVLIEFQSFHGETRNVHENAQKMQ